MSVEKRDYHNELKGMISSSRAVVISHAVVSASSDRIRTKMSKVKKEFLSKERESEQLAEKSI